ncbi:MAG: DUF4402 domain-containing protein [Bacteroidales bacterium]|jgi:hypothetical protein
MKRWILIFFVICTGLVFSIKPAHTQVHTNTEVAASAMLSIDVVVPIAARETQALKFGSFFPGTTGGTITITPSGSVNYTSGITIFASVQSAGIFTVSGQGDATYAINLPIGPVILTNNDGTSTMEVSGWTTVPENGDANMRMEGGAQTVSVGATLRVGSINENPRGEYTGSYEITFGYN